MSAYANQNQLRLLIVIVIHTCQKRLFVVPYTSAQVIS